MLGLPPPGTEHERNAKRPCVIGGAEAGLCHHTSSSNSSWVKNHYSFRKAELCRLLAIFKVCFVCRPSFLLFFFSCSQVEFYGH